MGSGSPVVSVGSHVTRLGFVLAKGTVSLGSAADAVPEATGDTADATEGDANALALPLAAETAADDTSLVLFPAGAEETR